MSPVLPDWKDWLWAMGELTIAAFAAVAIHRILFAALARIAARTQSVTDASLMRHARNPSAWIFPLFAVFIVLQDVPLQESMIGSLRHAVGLGLIAAIAWLVIELTAVVDDLVAAKYRDDADDNWHARRAQTQIQVLRRIIMVASIVIGFSAMLMTFPAIRHLGATLFASAGVAGLVAGIAARPALSNLIGGLQIALTEPIHLGDLVIVEGEFGSIEEIATTYVVVRVWDHRRLVVPFSSFLEKSFQNWTRRSTDIIGTVFIYVDYRVPVEELRRELRRILEATALWDGNSHSLQVTDATEHTMQLRALMSARDSSQAWDLRCYVREKLIEFLQQRYAQYLPRARVELLGAQPARIKDTGAASSESVPESVRPL